MTRSDPEPPRKSATKPRGKPFAPGNAGKPLGTRHRTTMAVEALLDGEAEALTRKAIDMALDGDATALRLVFERISPVRKGRTVKFTLPLIATSADVTAALGAVIAAVSDAELTPDEGASVAALLETKRRAIETVELEERLRALEEKS